MLAIRLGGSLEAAIYRIAGVDAKCEQPWKDYAITVLLFSA